MAKKLRKSKREKDKEKTLWFAVFGAVVILFSLESLLRDYPALLLVSRCIFTIPVLYWTWGHKSSKELPVAGKILSTVSFLLPWIVFVPVSRRIVMLISFVMIVVMTVYAIRYLRIIWWKDREKFYGAGVPVAAACLMMFMFVFLRSRFFVLVDVISFCYIPALLVAMGAVAVYVVYTVRKNKAFRHDGKKSTAIVMACIVLFLAFSAAMVTTDNLNYALDTSAQIELQVPILDKRTRRGGGKYGRTKYYVTVVLNGEADEIQVVSEVYYAHEVGDQMKVAIGYGAFGIPYLIPET